MDISFKEKRNLLGTVLVQMSLEGAYAQDIPQAYERYFEENTIGFYILSYMEEPQPRDCVKMVSAYIADDYLYDYVIESLFLDALHRANTLDVEAGIECLAIATTDYRKNKLYTLQLWRRFKELQGNNPTIKYWKSRVPERVEIKDDDLMNNILISESNYHRKNRFEFARLRTLGNRLGLPIEVFSDIQLNSVDEAFKDKAMETIPNIIERIIERYPKQQEQIKWYEGTKEYLDSLPARFFSVFDFEEHLKLYLNIYAYSPFSSALEGERRGRNKHPNPNPDYELADRLKKSMYQYGRYGTEQDWNTFTDAYNAIKDFRFGKGTDVSIDWPKYHNIQGWAKYSRIYRPGGVYKASFQDSRNYDRVYSDCKFVYIISKANKPLLYIGFSIAGDHKLLVCQIQLANSRGNRWLFKLGMPYFDYALTRLEEAFPEFDLYLVDGESLANKIRSNYSDENPLSPEKYQHIIKAYSKPLQMFRRTDETYQNVYKFIKLESN